MGLFNNFPYTNFHELNLDWIVGKIKEFGEKIESFQSVIDNIPTGESIGALREEVARVEGKADANTQAIADLPDEYPSPESVTFTGAVSATYDGSAPVTVNIPEGGELGGKLTFTGASDAVYDGSGDVTVNIPTAPPVGDAAPLTFTGAVSATYDGSSPVTVNIPAGGGAGDIAPLTFTGAVSATYDGSSPVTVNIPAGGGGVVKKYLAKYFVGPASFGEGTVTFDTPPADYSPEKCFLAEVGFYASIGESVYSTSTWTPASGQQTRTHQMWTYPNKEKIKYHQRTFKINLEAGTIEFGKGYSSIGTGAPSSGGDNCVPDIVTLYYLA